MGVPADDITQVFVYISSARHLPLFILNQSFSFNLSFEDVQIVVEPQRDRVQRPAEERGAARQEVGQEEVGEDRVHRQSRLGEKIFNHLGHYGFVIMANF